MRISSLSITAIAAVSTTVSGFAPALKLPFLIQTTPQQNLLTPLFNTDESAPSDYDSDDLGSDTQQLTVDENEEDASIRDALKRELLLIASVTNRGESATKEEKDIVVDLVTQLEALNPTADPAHNCNGEWDLCFASKQSFRSSPFFMAVRTALGDDNKEVADTGFDIHDRATTASRVGRVRQIISNDELTSEYEVAVGIFPGLPVSITGTIITSADYQAIGQDTLELTVKGTKVKGSNVPFLNQYLDDLAVELPVGDVYSAIRGSVPVSVLKTFYVDEGIRIVRDCDDNFFVFARA